MASNSYPESFVGIFQRCLDTGVIPREWKKQKLVLLPKPGKPPGDASSCRPICLINNLAKVFERTILDRLNKHLENPESPQLAENQFGFRRNRSTLQAIQMVVEAGERAMSFGRTNQRNKRCLMVVALDVKNAFNSASYAPKAEACSIC